MDPNPYQGNSLESPWSGAIPPAAAERLQQAAAAATAQRNDRNAQQLQAALAENRQLRAQLDEVRAKLDAITDIEQSIRERENGSDSQ